MSRRLHLHIHGRVQGVSYRAGAAAQARRLQLTGWVRNRQDGHVELLAEGDEATLQELLDWCRRGPLLARVAHLDASWTDQAAEFPSFAIAPDA
jgi:acylphosphatase